MPGDIFIYRIFSEEKKDPEECNENRNKKKIIIKRKARLIIRNISFKATEESLREHFTPYGDIIEVKLLKKPDGKLIGCAFVQYKNVPMAKKALLNTNMKPFLGKFSLLINLLKAYCFIVADSQFCYSYCGVIFRLLQPTSLLITIENQDHKN